MRRIWLHRHRRGSLTDILLGKPLPSGDERKERIGVLAGIPFLGLDALASASYGPEAALTLLLPVGALATGAIAWIAVAIVVLVVLVCFSYLQTIAAYPGGGGSYTVAKENLGPHVGLLAGTALLLDYMLNVAVAISAGVGAVVSAVPQLFPHTLGLCLLILVAIALVNLRGVRESGLVFSVPTYLFVGCLGATILFGVARALVEGGHPVPVVPPRRLVASTGTLSAWLLVRSFASGCTALTGVESVSNGVPVFREPTVRRARITLATIMGTLCFLLLGIGALCRAYHIGATPPGRTGYESVLSQMIAAVAGRGAFYYVAIASIFSVLALSANTSFAGFPRVCRLLALDRYLPEVFAHRGRRLVFSHGIVALSVLAGILLVAFGGITDRLIPLFAIGAFLAFTLSQAGMVAHWKRHRGRHARRSMVINFVGAVATATTLGVILVSKFVEGAWVIVLLLPAMLYTFWRIEGHYRAIDRQTAAGPFAPVPMPDPIVIIPLAKWTRAAEKALQFALRLSPDVRVVQVLGQEMSTHDLSARWPELVERPTLAAGLTPPRLEVIHNPYRELFGPLMDYIATVLEERRDRQVAVVVPELVERRWYDLFLHPHRAEVLSTLLLLQGNARLLIVKAPWYV